MSVKNNKQRWELHEKQYVEITTQNRVAFRYSSNHGKVYYGVSLTPRMFSNFCDIISCDELKENSTIYVYGNLFISLKRGNVKLYMCSIGANKPNRYFLFKPTTWKRYVHEIHRYVIDSLN